MLYATAEKDIVTLNLCPPTRPTDNPTCWYCCLAGTGGGEAPTGSNVQVGSRVKILDSKAAMEKAFKGTGYSWHPAMDKLLGKTVTVTHKWGAATFGLPKSDPNHSQATWYYPLAVIACVSPPVTTTTTPCKCPSVCETCGGVCNLNPKT